MCPAKTAGDGQVATWWFPGEPSPSPLVPGRRWVPLCVFWLAFGAPGAFVVEGLDKGATP